MKSITKITTIALPNLYKYDSAHICHVERSRNIYEWSVCIFLK